MKNDFLKGILLIAISLSLTYCSKDSSTEAIPETQNTQQNSKVSRNCGTSEHMAKAIAKNPKYKNTKDAIEKQVKQYETDLENGAKQSNTTFTIPVVVHVIYKDKKDNISKEQIQSQIDVLNQDFSKKNTDAGQVPKSFSSLVADAGIQFKLDKVNRVSTKVDRWNGDDMKSSKKGGADAIDPKTKLNIWVCKIALDRGQEILGFAYFPGTVNSKIDGAVIQPQFFGTTGTVSAPFNKGRTGTHEIGHWLNLEHMWGPDATNNQKQCDLDDAVADTPNTGGPNFGCPTFPTKSCKTTDMTMNYMDYVDDKCMYMFSKGQSSRMRSTLVKGGSRVSYVSK